MGPTLASWTPADLRRFIVNDILSNPGALGETVATDQNLSQKILALITSGKLHLPFETFVEYTTVGNLGTLGPWTIPQTHDHLLMLWTAKAAANTGTHGLRLRFNRDANNYYGEALTADVSAVAAGQEGNPGTEGRIGRVPDDLIGQWASGVIFVPNYRRVDFQTGPEGGFSPPYKNAFGLTFGYNPSLNQTLEYAGFLWNNAAAIQTVEMLIDGAGASPLKQGSRVSIFGVGLGT